LYQRDTDKSLEDCDRCQTSLRAVARVLKPGGRLGLLFRTNADSKAIASFPPEIYRFPALALTIGSARTGKCDSLQSSLITG
jgi:ubiquinone/menaquinone biosynthesis C-methylase UbiE